MEGSTMMRMMGMILGLVSIILFVGCSAQLSQNADVSSLYFTEKIGNATSYDLGDKSFRLLSQYHYRLTRFEQNRDHVYLETDWRYRFPFSDELLLGVKEAKTKVVISARPRKRSILNGSDMNVVRLYAENMVKLVDSDEWIRLPMTDMLRTYLNRLSNDLKTDFLTGIRKF